MQDTNQLICGDCLNVLTTFGAASCQLIYLDPPFNTNLRRTSSARTLGYADSFGTPAEYIAYMRPRVEQMQRVLSADGSLFFHCDWRMSHHVRMMLDEIFVGGKFVNEIIWRYGLGAARAKRHLLTKHDVIFWYANSNQYTFNMIRQDASAAMLDKYRHVDEQGNRYMNSYGKRYMLKGGKPLDDVWDMPNISPTAGERTGYPTQKPLALLQRIVQLASNAGDVVLDPFCGSGTTLVAAQQLGRQWIGIDASRQAITIARGRLKEEIRSQKSEVRS
jgi:site-specific DNA-methyltransferase (adenine-specific)